MNCIFSRLLKSGLISIGLAFFLGSHCVAGQSLTLSGATGSPGGTVLMNLSLSGSGGSMAAVQWTLQYASSSIASVTAVAGSSLNTAGKKISCSSAAGAYTCIASGTNASPIPDGSVAVVSVTLSASAVTSQISVNKTLGVSGSGTGVTVSGTAGTLNVQAAAPISTSVLNCGSTYLPLAGSTGCTIQLSGKVAVNTSIPLSVSNTVLTVPSSVTVPAGSSSASFTAVSTATAPATVTLSATLNGTASTSLSLTTLTVKSLTCTPTSLVAGNTGTCTVALTGAPIFSLLVSLTASTQALLIPQSVTVPAGATSATFSVSCTATSKGTVTITAALGGKSVTASIAVDVGTAFRFLTNSGGPAYTDSMGRTWLADSGFTGGSATNAPISIRNTSAVALYQTARTGAFTYTVNVPTNGNYLVNLKFAEISTFGTGNRLFNVLINGTQVLTNFDIFAASQGIYVAVDRTFPVSVTNGSIKIQFVAGTRGTPIVNAIEVVAAGYPVSDFPAVRINSGGSIYETAYFMDPGGASGTLGEFWSADRYFSGGSPCTGTPAILNTTAQALYQTCRLETTTYSIPVPNGDYTVTLKFAETTKTAAGQRKFDVTINDVKLLDEFDIFAAAGAKTAFDKVFQLKVSISQINIHIDPGAVDVPLVNAIQILPAGQGF